MLSEWDEGKNQSNIAKHGISFERAKTMFDGPCLTLMDDRKDDGEEREISLGLLEGIAVIVVVHTERVERTRIISARKANGREKRLYNETIRKRTDR